jgi:hypothetical protein
MSYEQELSKSCWHKEANAKGATMSIVIQAANSNDLPGILMLLDGQLLSAVRFSPYSAFRSGTSSTGLSRVDHCLPGDRAGNGEKAIYWTLTVVTSKTSTELGGIVGG